MVVLMALSLASCKDNTPDTRAVDFGDEAWEDANPNKSGKTYYKKKCGKELRESWAKGEPRWEYLDCYEANGGLDGKFRNSTSVREWRDREVAWESWQSELRQEQMLRDIYELLATGNSVDDIADLLTSVFSVPEEVPMSPE